jgi:hypothetical protein
MTSTDNSHIEVASRWTQGIVVIDAKGEGYVVRCQHGSTAECATKREARGAAHKPWSFCADCYDIARDRLSVTRDAVGPTLHDLRLHPVLDADLLPTSEWQRTYDTALIVRDLLRRNGVQDVYDDDGPEPEEDTVQRAAYVQLDDKTAIAFFGGVAQVWEDGRPVGRPYRCVARSGKHSGEKVGTDSGQMPRGWQPDERYTAWAMRTVAAVKAICERSYGDPVKPTKASR